MKQFPTHIVAVDGIIENDRDEILLVKNFSCKNNQNAWSINPCIFLR